MTEESLPSSAAPDEEPAALYEAAAELPADVASANGNGPSQKAHEAGIESRFDANHYAAGDPPPTALSARPLASGNTISTVPASISAFASATTSVASATGYTGESPDMLRWRAEMLLDEMMVGAVDASAGDQGAFFRQAPPLARAEWIVDEPYAAPAAPVDTAHDASSVNGNGVHRTPANGAVGNGASRRAPTPLTAKGVQEASTTHGTSTPNSPTAHNGVHDTRAHGSVVHAAGIVGADDPTSAPAHTGSPATNGFVLSNGIRGGSGNAYSQPGAAPAHDDDTVQAAARWLDVAGSDEPPILPAPFRPPPSVVARTAARSDAPAQSAQPTRNAAASAGAHPFTSTDPYSPEALAPVDFAPAASPPVGAPAPKAPNRLAGRTAPEESAAPATWPQTPTAPPSQSVPRKLTAVEQRYPSSGRTQNPARATGTHADRNNVDDDLPELGPIRRNPAVINRGTVTGSMEVGSRNSRYSALLPRSTPWDLHEMEREIAALSEEMTRVLPPGHESARRARHLLEKAQTIFVSDPQRSAEVDYYLSQVRAIVDRSRQTLQWAGLYRKRLVLYLMAWAILSAIVVAASLIFGDALGVRVSGAFGWAANGWAASNVAPALLALYGGALGGALGGLTNLQRYLAHGVGFIDRKYSLRGIILPVMGMVAGALIFGLVSGFFWIFGIGLNSSRLLELVPALLAFGLGFAQESIYGTRE